MEIKRLVIVVAVSSLIGFTYAKTIKEMEKEISSLNDEYMKLQKKPIVVWGKRQEGKSLVQKRATSTYNINIAQGSDRKGYKTKKVISVNPIYICPIHKYEYESGHCPVGCVGYGATGTVVRSPRRANDRSRKSNYDLDHCRSEKNFGTSNFCNLGQDYDLSYRTWKMLMEAIPAGVEQEKRLQEIEEEIAGIRNEIKTEQDAQQAERIAKKEAARAQQIENGKKKGVKGKKN